MKLTCQFLPLRINEVRHRIHSTLQEAVYLVAKVGWHLWRTASWITCCTMFHVYSLLRAKGSAPLDTVIGTNALVRTVSSAWNHHRHGGEELHARRLQPVNESSSSHHHFIRAVRHILLYVTRLFFYQDKSDLFCLIHPTSQLLPNAHLCRGRRDVCTHES